MKKNFPYFVFCILYFVFGMHAFAECNENAKTPGFDQYSEGKYSYECNVVNSCLGKKFGGGYWNFNTSKQLVKKHDKTKYPDLSKENKKLSDIQTIYQKTQDTIFECALLKSKYAAHKQILKDQKPPESSKKYLETLNQNIKTKLKEKDCLGYDDADKVYNYKDLLDSLTYEECVYNMYLYYYQETAEKNISILLGQKNGTLIAAQNIYQPFMGIAFAEEASSIMSAIDIAKTVEDTRNALENEYKLSRESLNNALKTYENFQENYVPHIMLEMNYIEIMKNKSLLAKIMHVIKDKIVRTVGAQKQ